MHPLFQQLQDQSRAEVGRVAWVITRDYIDSGAVGTAGPRSATDDEIAKARRGGRAFALYDDDGVLYYRGRIWTSCGPGTELDFAPLEDFGMPNAGAVDIRYGGRSL